MFPVASAYTMAKYAGEAFSDGLRLEMRKFGVKVVVVEPGNFGGATGMLNEKSVSVILICEIGSLHFLKFNVLGLQTFFH